jgi:mono/diheme cytochrome c family protein
MPSRFARVTVVAAGLTLAVTGLAAAADAARGEVVYEEQKCALCHSIAGKGNPRGSLDGVGTKLSAEDIKQWIVNPREMTAKTKADRKPPMKAYPNLSPADVDALVAYLQTLK